MAFDIEELKNLIQLFAESGLTEMELQDGGRTVRLQKSAAPTYAVSASPGMGGAMGSSAQGSSEKPAEEAVELGPTIDSPMVGTFYAAPAPGEDAFVKVGDRIDAGATVCIVEAMKLMNEVTAKFPCVIEQILVQNGEPVEFGQPLFAVRKLG